MGKINLLSIEVSKCRSMLAGGCSPTEIEKHLLEWKLSLPVKGPGKPSLEIQRWFEIILKAVRESKHTGHSLIQSLSKIQPLLRSVEGLNRKRQVLEKQFAMQGALGVVLPWSIAFFLDGFSLNFFVGAAIGLQLLGIFLFFFLFSFTFRNTENEESWILDFLNLLLPKSLTGNSFLECLKSAIVDSKPSSWKVHWNHWLSFQQASQYEKCFEWPANTKLSLDLSRFFERLIQTGSPASGVILDTIETLGFERNADFEEKMATLPSKISLIFCICFAPSVFLIVMGALWPMLQRL